MKTYNQFTKDIHEVAPLALAGMALGAYSAYSAAKNVQKGNYKGAALDALGMVPGGGVFKAARGLGATKNIARAASATQSVARNTLPTARNRAITGAIDAGTKLVTGGGNKDTKPTKPTNDTLASKTPSTPSSSVVLARKGGVQGKLDKSTGKWTKGDWSQKESDRYKRVSAQNAANKIKSSAREASKT